MGAPETMAPASDNALSAAQRPCEECRGLFAPKRGWSRFCTTKCRNDFHGRDRRYAALREAAPRMYAALAKIAAETGTPYATIATEALKGLKAP